MGKVHRNWRYTIEEVRNVFETRGYTLLEKDYKNSDQKLAYKCGKHPDKKLSITFSDLKNGGRGCVYCAGLNKPTIDEVRSGFKELGLTLLDTEYKNQLTKMKYRCNKHSNVIQETIYKTIKKGHGCRLCGREKAVKKLSGKGNGSWNGGISEIKYYLRKQINDWKFESLKNNDFRCDITGERGQDLQVHHLTPFHIIRDEVLAELNIPVYETIGEYSEKELSLLVEGVQRRHENELGVPLRYGIHRLFHREYGNDATKEDYEEFRERYKIGEFDEEEAVL